MRTRIITVGADGTAPGTAAVRWAAREAVRQDLPLRILHVLDWDWAVARYDFGGEHFNMARAGARSVVRDAARVAVEAAPNVVITEAQVRVGRTLAQLLNVSVGAAQLVVGGHSSTSLTERLLGSKGQRLAAHAHCPVVVVRGRAGPAGPVATEVDDPDAADAVLDTAFAEAAGRDTGLVVVHSYTAPPATGPEQPDPETAERDRLTEQLAPWQAKYPHVRTETLICAESTAATLVEISHGTQLIVVGGHGHGLLSAKTLGSTTTHLLHQADCPVLVVRG